MLEQNDEWAVTRRYMTLETVAAICEDNIMDPAKKRRPVNRLNIQPENKLHHVLGHYRGSGWGNRLAASVTTP